MEPGVPGRGYLTMGGSVRPELLGVQATAGAMRLRQSEVPVQELGFTVEALGLILRSGKVGPDVAARLRAAVADALATVARSIQQPNNPGLVAWLTACAGAVTREKEVPAFLAHLRAVLRHYGALAALDDLPRG